MAGVLDHVGFQCADLAASAAFYDVALEPLGGQRIMDFGVAIGYGAPDRPDFWISAQETGDGFRESHVSFTAPSRAAVRAFFDAAVAAGAAVLHEPRLWPEYHETYYGAFVRDPDGNNVEAVCHLPELPVHSTAGALGARPCCEGLGPAVLALCLVQGCRRWGWCPGGPGSGWVRGCRGQ
jgi:catechol 2,3-dioxygenase-like lactoylglutathione lyase family enzyme